MVCVSAHRVHSWFVGKPGPESDDGPKGEINLASLASDELDALSPASEKQDGIKAMDTDDTDASAAHQQSHAGDMAIAGVGPASIAATSAAAGTMQAAY